MKEELLNKLKQNDRIEFLLRNNYLELKSGSIITLVLLPNIVLGLILLSLAYIILVMNNGLSAGIPLLNSITSLTLPLMALISIAFLFDLVSFFKYFKNKVKLFREFFQVEAKK